MVEEKKKIKPFPCVRCRKLLKGREEQIAHGRDDHPEATTLMIGGELIDLQKLRREKGNM